MDQYNYNMPPQQPVYVNQESDMSVGDWIVTFILLAIPIVNFICLIMWAFNNNTDKKSRKNFAIAYFIMMVIGVVLVVAFSSVITAMLVSLVAY